MSYLTLESLDLRNKRVIIRVDLNVPMQNKTILNDARLRAILPTLQMAIKAEARILLLSHLGRPKEGEYTEEFSLQPIADNLAKLLNHPIQFKRDWLNTKFDIAPQQVVLGENVRFNKGEEKNDSVLAKQMAALCDVFIMDAFAASHRAQASTVGIAEYAPVAAAGPLLVKELTALNKILTNPKRPCVAIVGGAKVSSKLEILKSLLQKVDYLILGGGIANTFLKAKGYTVGRSLVEENLIDTAKEIMSKATQSKVEIVLPEDVIVANEISDKAITREVSIDANEIAANEMILDIGSFACQQYHSLLEKVGEQSGAILWNGPVGVFEKDIFARGTASLSNSIANATAKGAYSVAGGGETLAAIEKFGVADQISYISTGGGAFLEYLEGKTLPAVAVLEKRGET